MRLEGLHRASIISDRRFMRGTEIMKFAPHVSPAGDLHKRRWNASVRYTESKEKFADDHRMNGNWSIPNERYRCWKI